MKKALLYSLWISILYVSSNSTFSQRGPIYPETLQIGALGLSMTSLGGIGFKAGLKYAFAKNHFIHSVPKHYTINQKFWMPLMTRSLCGYAAFTSARFAMTGISLIAASLSSLKD